MSFTFKWPRFSEQFHADAIQMLTSALNKGNKPPVIADRIEVVELEMGSQPPELEIRDIGELTMDQFRGIFRLTYSGDAYLVLRTKVQANPLNHKQPDIHLMTGSRGMLAAKQPLVVPMLLRLSHFKLNSYVVLVVSKQKGITLVFKTDPLQNVDINSTFDSIAVIQKFIQREIEGQLRQMFREDLPGIIHRLSQQWFKAKVEAPYLSKRLLVPPPPPPSLYQPTDTMSSPRLSPVPFPPTSSHAGAGRLPTGRAISVRRAKSSSGLSAASRMSASIPISPGPSTPEPQDPSALPDIENFDPSYGLRPEGLPTKSLFGKFSKLFAPNKGLAELSEEQGEEEDFDYEGGSFDYLPWDDTTIPPTSPSVLDDLPEEPDTLEDAEYETIPAVGGGVVTRPRVYHSQSQIQTPTGPSSTPPSALRHFRRAKSMEYEPSVTSFRSSLPSRPTSARPSFRPSPLSNPYFANYDAPSLVTSADGLSYVDRPKMDAPPSGQPLYCAPAMHTTHPPHRRSQSGGPIALPTPPPSDSHTERSMSPTQVKRPLERRPSTSSSLPDGFHFVSPPDSHGTFSSDPDPNIILRPSVNDHISKLSTLSHSNHTLSPYTRSLEHFTVRSVPPRGSVAVLGRTNSSDRQTSTKAKRRRTYRIGGARQNSAQNQTPQETISPSPVPPPEFDASDMDRYFKWRDEVVPHFPPDIHPSHVRRRPSKQPT